MATQRIRGQRGAILALLALVVACQRTPSMVVSAWGKGPDLPKPARPAVLKRSDEKDPFSYLEVGDRMLGRGRADSAAAAFYWASRLDPTIARPYYARSVALLLTYVRPRRDTTGSALWEPKTSIPPARLMKIDSLRREALARDPFLPPSYDHLFTGRPSLWMIARIADPGVRGLLFYDVGRAALADSLLGVALRAEPGRALLREVRARAEYDLGRYDSAAANLRVLLDTLSHRDSVSLRLTYRSKELMYYALGYAEAQRGDTAGARRAFEDAIGENAAFYPAHARLATLASERGDPVTAAAELAAATELAPNDASLRFFYGAALLESGATARAITALLATIDLDPWFAKPYLYLGKAYEMRGDSTRALEAYEEYASRERMNEPQRARAIEHADQLRARTNR